MDSQPRHDLACAIEGPLMALVPSCRQRQGWSWTRRSETERTGPRASCCCDDERSDAVDGHRLQLPRHGAGLALCRARLSEVRGGTLLGGGFALCIGRRRDRDAARKHRAVPAAGGRRRLDGAGVLPGGGRRAALLRYAGVLAHAGVRPCSHRVRTCGLHLWHRRHGDAHRGLFDRPVHSAALDAEADAGPTHQPDQSRRPAGRHHRARRSSLCRSSASSARCCISAAR